MMGWDDYRLVLAIGRERGLKGAARVLGVDHSTAFRRLREIERKAGARMFERSGGGYEPTEAGTTVIEHATRMEQEALAAERAVTGRDTRLSGTVRITTTEDVAVHLLGDLLAEFAQTAPEVTVEVATADRFFSLTRREADIAIRPARDPRGDMVGRKVGDIAFALYGAPDYLDGRGRPGRWQEIEGHDLILCDESMLDLPWAERLHRQRTGARVALRANTLLLQAEAARRGMGLAVLPCFLGDGDPALERLWPPERALASELWILIHPDMKGTARVRAFADFAYRHLRRGRRRLEGHAEAAVRRA